MKNFTADKYEGFVIDGDLFHYQFSTKLDSWRSVYTHMFYCPKTGKFHMHEGDDDPGFARMCNPLSEGHHEELLESLFGIPQLYLVIDNHHGWRRVSDINKTMEKYLTCWYPQWLDAEFVVYRTVGMYSWVTDFGSPVFVCDPEKDFESQVCEKSRINITRPEEWDRNITYMTDMWERMEEYLELPDEWGMIYPGPTTVLKPLQQWEITVSGDELKDFHLHIE